MLTFRVISIFSAVISRTIGRLSQNSIARSCSILTMPWLTQSEPKRGSGSGISTAKVRNDAEKAVAIAPALAEAHAALGWVRFFVEWKFAEGLSELRRAKELSPANPTANDLLARVIVYLGKTD